MQTILSDRYYIRGGVTYFDARDDTNRTLVPVNPYGGPWIDLEASTLVAVEPTVIDLINTLHTLKHYQNVYIGKQKPCMAKDIITIEAILCQ